MDGYLPMAESLGAVSSPISRQQTIRHVMRCTGVGLHSGRAVNVTLRPAGAGAGIVFRRVDLGVDIPARFDAVSDTRLCTVLAAPGRGDAVVGTVEHLMAALCGKGVDNVVVELDGPELPIMDGSALPFVKLIDQAGRRTQEEPRRYIEILSQIEVFAGDKRAALGPCASARPGLEVEFDIAFRSAAIGAQHIQLRVDEASFRRDLAAARTFGFVQEVEALRARGLAQAGSLDNAIVVDGDRILNPEGLRFTNEFVRHKALDAVGDLYILGAPVIGRFEGRFAGHALNNALVRAVVANSAAWRIRTFAEPLAEAV